MAHRETRIYVLEVELKMDACQTVKEKTWVVNLTLFQLHGMKMPSDSNSSPVIKMEQNNKQKRRRYGVGNKIKMTSNVGSVIKIESRREVFDEVKKR